MRILIVVNSLQAGGAERAAIRTAQGFAQDNYEVILATWTDKRDFYELPDNLNRINLGDPFEKYKEVKYFFQNIPLIGRLEFLTKQLFYIRREIRKYNPDVVIAFEAFIGVVTALALCNTGIPLVVSERVNPDPDVYRPHVIATKLRPMIYKLGAICAVQTAGFAEYTRKCWNLNSFIVPNHIFEYDLEDSISDYQPKFSKQKVIAVGRLADQKDYQTLLQAWQIIEQSNDFATLDIYGAGNENLVKDWISEYNLKRVTLNSPSSSIKSKIKQSTILVSTSKFEGFPNVVLEALSCGVPVISTMSTDILSSMSAKGGVLLAPVKDYKVVAAKLKYLLENVSAYEELALKTLETARVFLWERVRNDWFNVVSHALKSNGVKFPNVKFFKKI